MRNWTIALFCSLASIPAFAGQLRPAPLNPAIDQALAECGSAVFNSEAAACPSVAKYTYSARLSPAQLDALISRELGYDLTSTDGRGAVSALLPRASTYTQILRDDPEAGDARTYRASVNRLLMILNSMARGAGNLTSKDEDTYWAPSVNAAAVVVANPAKKTIYVFVLGDTDG